MRASAVAYRNLNMNLRQAGDTQDSTAKVQTRLRESGWLNFVQDDSFSLDETTVVEIDNPELGHELHG
eukprot:702931-Prorocentrum_minimum.AAC.1